MAWMRVFILGLSLFLVFISLNFASAFSFNGTVYDINGIPLNNSVINVTVRSVTDFSIVGYNFTTTNSSGWFNFSVSENSLWMYEPMITHGNGSYIDYIGQNLPAFPAFLFSQLSSTLFYLDHAGTINITAINSTGARIPFDYQIKDTKLGYPIAESFSTTGGVKEINLVVPRNRNYSIMIYPNQSLPVSFNWNNFTSANSYTFSSISSYNASTKTLHKQFNTTLSTPRVSGYINYTTGGGIAGWNEFTVVAFMFEPGNMVHAKDGTLPYNLSAFVSSGTDFHNRSSGFFFYNITLPASAETAAYLLFATARNGSGYYGGVANISLAYGAADTQVNFTMYGLLGVPSNFSMNNAGDFSTKKFVTTAKQQFQLINSTNGTLGQTYGHIEVTVDYSNYGATEFTWMIDTPQTNNGNFSIPLLNITGIKEMNIFVSGGNYAPKRITPSLADLISNNNANANSTNITIKSFNPQAIDSALSASAITMALYISNSSCDVPSPAAGCAVGSSSSMSDFNPMSAIIGGGKLSFRMGTGNIAVHYVNVDMMASGPPDALFDSANTDRGSSSNFDQAVRFGSGGPTVYDYVLVSIPYSETAGSGLNDTAEVNITLPLLYDDNWNVIWNASSNGTDIGALKGNYSHYSSRSGEWSQLMNKTVCTNATVTNTAQINSTNPCYIDKTNNRIWIRLPHFSGTGPSVTGNVVAVAPSSSSSSSSSGGGSGTTINITTKTKSLSWTKITPGNVTIMKINDPDIGLKQISIEVNNPAQNVRITVTKYKEKPANVSVEKTGKVYKYLEISTQNLKKELKKAVISLQVKKSWIEGNRLGKDKIALFKYDEDTNEWKEIITNHVSSDSENEYYDIEVDSFSFFAIAEKTAANVVDEPVITNASQQEEAKKETEQEKEGKTNKIVIWIIVVIIVIILAGILYYLLAVRQKDIRK